MGINLSKIDTKSYAILIIKITRIIFATPMDARIVENSKTQDGKLVVGGCYSIQQYVTRYYDDVSIRLLRYVSSALTSHAEVDRKSETCQAALFTPQNSKSGAIENKRTYLIVWTFPECSDEIRMMREKDDKMHCNPWWMRKCFNRYEGRQDIICECVLKNYTDHIALGKNVGIFKLYPIDEVWNILEEENQLVVYEENPTYNTNNKDANTTNNKDEIYDKKKSSAL